jgi:hypothetical protein
MNGSRGPNPGWCRAPSLRCGTIAPPAVGARPRGHGGGTRAIHPGRARHGGPATPHPASACGRHRSAPHPRQYRGGTNWSERGQRRAVTREIADVVDVRGVDGSGGIIVMQSCGQSPSCHWLPLAAMAPSTRRLRHRRKHRTTRESGGERLPRELEVSAPPRRNRSQWGGTPP